MTHTSQYRTTEIIVLHILSGDLWAGAEKMVGTLLAGLRHYPNIKILALSLNEGILTASLRAEGIETIVIAEQGYSFGRTVLRALRILRGRRIRIIHAHRYKENLLAFLVGKLLGVNRLVTTLHGLPEGPRDGHRLVHDCGYKVMFDYFILRRAFSKVIAVSQDMRRRLIQEYGFKEGKVELIYNGIDLPKEEHREPSHERIIQIGTVGRMVAVKDFGLFLRVANAILKHEKNVQFSILGDGPLKEELVESAHALGLQEYLRFEAPRTNPWAYYNSLNLYLNTSVYEGLPLSILEAMAAGLPVVAPRVGGIPEVIHQGEHGYLIDSRDPEEFATCCLELIRQPNLRIAMAKNASKRIAGYFSADHMVASYHSLYESLNVG